MATFKDQILLNSVVTVELLDKVEDKFYHSGAPILPGDRVLFGMITSHTKTNEVNITMVKFKESEIDVLYTILNADTFIPTIEKI